MVLHHDEIDEQHEHVQDALNAFVNAGRNHEGADAILQALDGFVRETNEHFEAEEKMMRECGYPSMEVHKQRHAEFVRTIEEMGRDLRGKGATEEAVVEMGGFLSDWLEGHTVTTDAALTRFLAGEEPVRVE